MAARVWCVVPWSPGDPSDPYPTLAPALAAVPATGGVVVVGSGTHTGLVAATDAGTGGSRLGVYGGFPAASIALGATATSLLTAFDPVGSPSLFDGTASDPSTIVGQVGHLERIAAADPEPVLRGEATDELGTHLTDPLVRPRTAQIHATVTARLTDADPGVVRAAVRALLAARQGPASEAQEAAVRRIAAEDLDPSLRAMAAALLARWAGPR